MLATVFERRFGDASEDGFDWDREPPTSILGGSVAEGLCFVGRAPVGTEPAQPSPGGAGASGSPAGAGAGAPGAARCAARRSARRRPASSRKRALPRDVEVEVLLFQRAQPDLARFAAASAPSMSAEVGGGPLLYQVAMIWSMFDAAFPGRLPRLRRPISSALAALRGGISRRWTSCTSACWSGGWGR